MGIRGLNTLIKKLSPECITTNPISKYENKRFIIDATILVYKFRYVSNINTDITNYSHIIGFINRILYYKNNNITPIFVFDGKPPIEKRETLLKRQQNKQKIKDKIELLQNIDTINTIEQNEIDNEIKKLNNQIINITKAHITECKRLLDILNIKHYTSPDEAEKYCVFLYNNGYGDYIVSDDTDVFTFGGKNVLKTSIKNHIIETDINIFLNKINYDEKKFIDLCILSGCDYLPFIPQLAINTVYNLLKKHDTIEDIISLNKYMIPQNYDYKNVRNIFTIFTYELPVNDNLLSTNIDKKLFEEYLKEFNIINYQKILNKF